MNEQLPFIKNGSRVVTTLALLKWDWAWSKRNSRINKKMKAGSIKGVKLTRSMINFKIPLGSVAEECDNSDGNPSFSSAWDGKTNPTKLAFSFQMYLFFSAFDIFLSLFCQMRRQVQLTLPSLFQCLHSFQISTSSFLSSFQMRRQIQLRLPSLLEFSNSGPLHESILRPSQTQTGC